MSAAPAMAALPSVRRKTALLGAASVLLLALGLQAYALGYPMGMSMLAASTVQAGICSAMFSSRGAIESRVRERC